jgi:hypothetical protein
MPEACGEPLARKRLQKPYRYTTFALAHFHVARDFGLHASHRRLALGIFAQVSRVHRCKPHRRSLKSKLLAGEAPAPGSWRSSSPTP